jgi:hypothetical protein
VSSASSALEHAEVLVVGLAGKAILPAILAGVRPHHQVVDLVGVPALAGKAQAHRGVCW